MNHTDNAPKVEAKSWITNVVPISDFNARPHETVGELLSVASNAINAFMVQGASRAHIQWHKDIEFEGKTGCAITIDVVSLKKSVDRNSDLQSVPTNDP